MTIKNIPKKKLMKKLEILFNKIIIKLRKPFELIVSRDLSLYFSSGATLLDGVHDYQL